MSSSWFLLMPSSLSGHQQMDTIFCSNLSTLLWWFIHCCSFSRRTVYPYPWCPSWGLISIFLQITLANPSQIQLGVRINFNCHRLRLTMLGKRFINAKLVTSYYLLCAQNLAWHNGFIGHDSRYSRGVERQWVLTFFGGGLPSVV